MDDPSSSSRTEPRIESLVLDAGPLVTQSPLKGLAKTYYIPRSVVDELKDKRARDHLAWLQSEAGGCNVQVMEPGPAAMVAVTAFAKKTGDYSVLSKPDMTVLALTYSLEFEKHGTWRIRDEVGGKTGQQKHTIAQQAQLEPEDGKKPVKARKERNLQAPGKQEPREQASASSSDDAHPPTPTDDPSDLPTKLEHLGLDQVKQSPLTESAETSADIIEEEEDDEETGGEWITPDNITKHKNKALGLVTDDDLPLSSAPTTRSFGKRRTQIAEADDGWSTVVSKNTADDDQDRRKVSTQKALPSKQVKMTVACMTGDYAVQNVLLQMGLSLVGLEGQKIKQVRSWVLRCHACFKICKDADKKFCPQCGNPTLMRTSVTSSAPDSKGGDGFKVHLKKNFQYNNRGTIFSLPLPKAGKAGGSPQSVPILREDQPEWQKAVNAERIKRQKEERALQKALERGSDSLSARYEDADELSMLLAGGSGKNRTISTGLPSPGVGRKNPNERRRRQV